MKDQSMQVAGQAAKMHADAMSKHGDAIAKLHAAIMAAQPGGPAGDPSQMMGDPSQGQDQGGGMPDPQAFVQSDPQGAADYADQIMQHLAALIQDQMGQPNGQPQTDQQPAPYVGGGGAGY